MTRTIVLLAVNFSPLAFTKIDGTCGATLRPWGWPCRALAQLPCWSCGFLGRNESRVDR